MADFHPVRCLLAYSGGTVPDSDRIHYSPPVLSEAGGTQMLYFQAFTLYSRKKVLSIHFPAFRAADDGKARMVNKKATHMMRIAFGITKGGEVTLTGLYATVTGSLRTMRLNI